LKKAAKANKLAFFHLEGAKIEGKDQFLNHAAVALHFPDYFGKNWDAFDEMITDLSWVEGDFDGYLFYFDHIDPFHSHHKAELETALEIFQDAADAWDEEDKAFILVLSGSKMPKGASRT
jgi:RNAse (barnase) inhibitor barstar